jgi:hypothetical protein
MHIVDANVPVFHPLQEDTVPTRAISTQEEARTGLNPKEYQTEVRTVPKLQVK